MAIKNDGIIVVYGVIMALVTLAGLAAVYFGTAAPKENAEGIMGNVTLGPTCPGPQRENEVCWEPYQAYILIKDEGGNELITVRSDDKGQFRVSLPKGKYLLEPLSPNTLPRASPQSVIVVKGRFTEVMIEYDTGIR